MRSSFAASSHWRNISQAYSGGASPSKVDLELCVRERDTPAQMDLPFAQRRRNVRGAFRCTRAILGARVAVVDDVMTTGETLNEIAAVLKNAGAVRVVNWVVARTFPAN